MLRRLIQSFKDDTVSPWTRIALGVGGFAVFLGACFLVGGFGKLLLVIAIIIWLIAVSTDYSLHE